MITGFVRRIRRLVLEQKARLGRAVFLSARVPATVELGLRIGIDLPAWLKEGLLDMVVISNGLLPFSTPWKEIGDLASKAGIPALACFTYPRATAEGRESLRAATYRAFTSGMSGIHLWNYFYAMPHYHGPADKYLGLEFTHDIADRKGLVTGAKHYLLDSSVHTKDRLASTFGHAELPGQVPLMIGHSRDGIAHRVTFDIADDLSAAPAARRPNSGSALSISLLKTRFGFSGTDSQFSRTRRVLVASPCSTAASFVLSWRTASGAAQTILISN